MSSLIKKEYLIGIFLILFCINYSIVNSNSCYSDEIENILTTDCLNYTKSLKNWTNQLIDDYQKLMRNDDSLTCVFAVKSIIEKNSLIFKNIIDDSFSTSLIKHLEESNVFKLDVVNNCENKLLDIINCIRRGDNTEASRIFKHSNLLLKDIIIQTYGKNERFLEKIIEFIDITFPDKDDTDKKMQAYLILLDQMISNSEINHVATMTIAYRAIQSMNSSTDAAIIIEKLPSHIRNFPWGKRVKLQNGKHFDYLYGSSVVVMGRRSIFNKNNFHSTNSSYFWKIEPIDNGKYNILSIDIENQDEYLYQESKELSFDEIRGNIFTSNNDKMLELSGWQFEPIAQQTTFRIKNIFWDHYLYASADNFNFGLLNRRSFAWLDGGCEGLECTWNVIYQ